MDNSETKKIERSRIFAARPSERRRHNSLRMRLCDIQSLLRDCDVDAAKSSGYGRNVWIFTSFFAICGSRLPLILAPWTPKNGARRVMPPRMFIFLHVMLLSLLWMHGPLGRFSQQRYENENPYHCKSILGARVLGQLLEQILNREYRILRFQQNSAEIC